MFCAHLLICASWSPAGKGLTSWLSFVVSSVSLSLSHWYPGSGVVLDCIDSWSLQPDLLCHDLQNDFHTFVVRLQVLSSMVCYSLVRLNTAFNWLTGHLQGLHTAPPTFVRVRFHTIYIRYWHGWAHLWMGLHVRLYIRSHTVLYDRLYDYTRTWHPCQF